MGSCGHSSPDNERRPPRPTLRYIIVRITLSKSRSPPLMDITDFRCFIQPHLVIMSVFFFSFCVRGVTFVFETSREAPICDGSHGPFIFVKRPLEYHWHKTNRFVQFNNELSCYTSCLNLLDIGFGYGSLAFKKGSDENRFLFELMAFVQVDVITLKNFNYLSENFSNLVLLFFIFVSIIFFLFSFRRGDVG